MSPSARSNTDIPAAWFPRLLAGAALAAGLWIGACDPSTSGNSGKDPADTTGDGDNAFLEVTGLIPQVIFSETLEVVGKARSGDTVLAMLNKKLQSKTVAVDGRFQLRLPVPRSDSAQLRLYAVGADKKSSPSEFYYWAAPGLDLTTGFLPALVNKDTFDFYLTVFGYDSVLTRLNGGTGTQAVKNQSLYARFIGGPNGRNSIVLRGLRRGVPGPDSLEISVLHDNQAPRLLTYSFNTRNAVAGKDTTLTLAFDDSVPSLTVSVNRSGIVGGAGISFDPDRKRYYLKFFLGAADSANVIVKGADRAGNRIDSTILVRTFLRHIAINDVMSAFIPSQRENIVYAAISGGGKLLVLDAKVLRVIDTIPIPAGDVRPVVNPYNKYIYIPMPSTQSLQVIDPFTKTVVREAALPKKFYETYGIIIAFRADGLGLLTYRNLEDIYYVDSRQQDLVTDAGLFPKGSGISSTVYTLDSSRILLIDRSQFYHDLYCLRAGDTAAVPVLTKASDRVVSVWGVDPYRDIIALSDQRLIDSRGNGVGNHLFAQYEIQFGLDGRGADYLIRHHGEGTQLDRFNTTGLSEIKVRSGWLVPLSGSDDLLVVAYKDLFVIDLGMFGP